MEIKNDHLADFGITTGQGKYGEECIYSLVLVYTLLFNDMSSYLAHFQLTPAKLNVLMIIKHQGKDKGLSQIDIGKRLLVTASNMTRLLDKLEKEGLIVKVAQAGDKRVKVIKVTPKASKLLDDAWPGYVARLHSLSDRLNPAEQKQMAGLLNKWLHHLA